MFSFKKYLIESGGRMYMGINALQATHRDIQSIIKKYKQHLRIEQGSKHYKILDINNNIVSTLTTGKIGPKTAIDTLSRIRDHLVRVGAYKTTERESRSVTAKRQNIVIDEPKSSGLDVERIKEKIKKYKGIIRDRQDSLGRAKRGRIERAIGRLQGIVSTEASQRGE